MRRKLITAGTAVAALGAIAYGGTALAGGGGDGGSVTGPAAEQAKAAAIQAVGGTVNAVERDSEDGATWEVEVKTSNGSVVDVRLDAGFNVVVVEGDSEVADSPDSDSNDDGSDAD